MQGIRQACVHKQVEFAPLALLPWGGGARSPSCCPQSTLFCKGFPCVYTSVLFAPPSQSTSALGTRLGSRTGADLVYPPFNVLLTDTFLSQEEDQVHSSRCIQRASGSSLPGGAVFQQYAAVPLCPAGVLEAMSAFWVSPQPCHTFAIPCLQPMSLSFVQKEEMLSAEAAPLSTSFCKVQLCILSSLPPRSSTLAEFQEEDACWESTGLKAAVLQCGLTSSLQPSPSHPLLLQLLAGVQCQC